MLAPQRPRSLLAEAYDHHYPDFSELEREARRLRAKAFAELSLSAYDWMWRAMTGGVAAVDREAASVPAVPGIEQDLRYRKAEAIADTIVWLLRLPQAGVQWIQAVRVREQAEAALYGMNDRELKDLGLTRAEIPAALAGEIYRPAAPDLRVKPAASGANENVGALRPAVSRGAA